MKRNAVAWAALVVSTAALVSSRGFTRPVPAAPGIPAEGQRAAKSLSDAFEAVADFVKPSVVQIRVHRKAEAPTLRGGRMPFPFPGPGNRNPREVDPKEFQDLLKRFFGPDVEPEQEQFGFSAEGTGSGFVYDDKGHILTNNHVVNGADKITVTFYDGTEAEAKIVGTDPPTDVAVIKVDNTDYHPVLKGQSRKLHVGEWVLAVGSPFGLEQTVTAGIISATNRTHLGINGEEGYEDFIQTDASINPGNSGGPLVDLDGRVVGINSAIFTRSSVNAGVGFAIPIDLAGAIADKLVKDGKVTRARLGVVIEPLTPSLAKHLGLEPKTKGILVNSVAPGSPAEKAGLKQGDVITSFDGMAVSDTGSLRNTVATSDLGKSYTLNYLRDGREHRANVVLVPEDQVQFAFSKGKAKRSENAKPDQSEFSDFGLSVQELTPELAEQLNYAEGTKGLLITSVKPGSPADEAGLEQGFVITKAIKDRKIQPVGSLKDFEGMLKNSDEVALHVQTSSGAGRFITLKKAK